jgi:hypothetical protein
MEVVFILTWNPDQGIKYLQQAEYPDKYHD